MNARCFLHILFTLVGTSSFAQSPTTPIRVGDTLPSGDHVTEIRWIHTDDDGAWLAWVDSDFGDVTRDGFLLRNGQEVGREGSALAAPAGSTLGELASFAWDENGDLAAIAGVRNPSEVVGLVFVDQALFLTGDLIGAPEVPPAAKWLQLDAVWLNPARTLLVAGEIDNPGVVGTSEDSLVRLQLDGGGAVSARNVLLTEGQFVPLVGGVVTSLNSSATSFALNLGGDFVGAIFSSGNPQVIVRNLDTLLARQGDPAPIAGRTYRSFMQSKMALNDFRENAFSCQLNGLVDSYCIIKDGQKFVQEGDVLASLPQPVGDDGDSLAPIFLGNSGDLFWRQWDDNHLNDSFMRNYDVIVLRDSTVIGGQVVVGLSRSANAFHVSRDGRFWVGRVELQTPGEVLLMADFGLVVRVPGCGGNTGVLRKASGDARAGRQLVLELDGGSTPGAVTGLTFATQPAIPGSSCGLPIPGIGELLVRPSSRIATLFGAPWSGAPVPFPLAIPNSASLVDLELFAQGAFVDTSGPGLQVQLTNGLRIQVGAP